MTELEEDILLDDELLEEQPEEHEHWRIEVDKGQNPVRVDKFLMDHMPGTSRNRIQKAAEAGSIRANDKPIKNNYKVKAGDIITLVLDHPKRDWEIVPEDLPLDVVYEDEVLLVINKPAGLVVHPGCGNYSGTLVNALAWHLRDDKGFDPNDPTVGLVHRIDKDTSGLLIVAKNDKAHIGLAEQIKEHSFTREYEAVVYGKLKDPAGTVDAPIGRHKTDRKKMCVTPNNSKNAVTHYRVIDYNNGFSHVALKLETGRTHQIRVHMSYIGHPVAGDSVYGPSKVITSLNGQCLHAKKIGFVHPITNEELFFDSELPDYFQEFLKKNNLI